MSKTTYDINAPISEYTEQQIEKRIFDELGYSAMFQYSYFAGCDFDEERFLCVVPSNGLSLGICPEYFANDFFKEAVVRKAKKYYSGCDAEIDVMVQEYIEVAQEEAKNTGDTSSCD